MARFENYSYTIESSAKNSDFLFCHGKKFLNQIFKHFVENRPIQFHIWKFRVCVSTL